MKKRNEELKELKKLRVKGKFELYKAGLPSYPRIFTRDSVISALLMKDLRFLKDFLEFAVKHQGKEYNPKTGEKPGKIFHEYPAVKLRGLSTEYNSADSTALFLIGMGKYVKKTKDWKFVRQYKENIMNSVSYILAHIMNGLYFEGLFKKIKRYALKITYWKDSETLRDVVYPVIYALAHIQAMAGLRAAAFLLKDKKLKEKADDMKFKLKKLFGKKTGFFIAKDKKGAIKAVSSDSLHALFYLDKRDISKEMLNVIVKTSKVLETKIGYRVLEPKKAKLVKDPYHSKTVWPFEQAIIHAGAKKFGLKKVMKVAERIKKVLDTSPEIFYIDESGKKYKKGENDPQLWTIAAKKYFDMI